MNQEVESGSKTKIVIVYPARCDNDFGGHCHDIKGHVITNETGDVVVD